MSNQTQPKILTEEVIQKFDEHNKQHAMSYAVDVLIKSHRLLFSANAELSFKNTKYKEAMVVMVENMESMQSQIKALEELK